MVLQFLIVMAVAALVFVFVLAPLRRDGSGAGMIDPRLLADRDRAQLAKDRKLDEIRELRADRQAGKLTDGDARALERALRAEAADLLHQLDEAEAAIDAAEAELGDASHATGDPLR
jgi:hypothetical protein